MNLTVVIHRATTAAITLVAVGVLASCAAKPAPIDEEAARARQQAEAEVRLELEAYYRDFSARRWNAFASHFWPGATIATIWQPPGEPRQRVIVHTIPEFLAQTSHGPDSKPIFWERMLDADVRIEGDLAQAWARYEAEFGDVGDVQRWTGIDAFTLLKHDGRWRIVSLTFAAD